jgi:hypothetical protein
LLLEALEGAEGGVYGVRQLVGGLSAPSGPKIRQNIEWFECPPPLSLTAVRISSGTDPMFTSNSSTLPGSASGCFSSGREIGHIGVVVLLVMEVHGLFVYDRL